jgi:hypothetical protein
MGAVGSLVVPAVILVFTVAHEQAKTHPVQLALVTGLLVLGLIGSLVSAAAFAALAGEKHLTANLPPAAMLMGVAAILGIIAILAAFETLADIYLPSSRVLFAGIVAGGGVIGAIFTSLSVVDDWEIRLSEPGRHGPSRFRSRRHAHSWAAVLSLVGTSPIVVGFIIFCAHGGIEPSSAGANVFVGIGIVIAFLAVLWGTKRTLHPDSGHDDGVLLREAIAAECAIGGYLLVLLLLLPS